jgi:hypothetical protein
MTESQEMATVYVDLGCDAQRANDRALVWRGELRARSAASGANAFSTDRSSMQRLVDHAMSDASRELASDLAVRALALAAEPSARVFADEEQQRAGAGLDDGPFGPAALSETTAAAGPLLAQTKDLEAPARAAAWNVVAMAAGPGDPWVAGERMHLDDDSFVRFFQYKALARLGSATALGELRTALAREEDGILAELVADAVASGGIGLARSKRP